MSNHAAEAEQNIVTIRSQIALLHNSHWGPLLTSRDYESFWAHVHEISALFKQLWLPRDVREELWEEFHSYVEAIKADRQAERERRSAESREPIESAIHSAGAYVHAASTKDEFFDAKDRVKEIIDLFKGRFLLRHDREECWESYQELRDAVKSKWEQLSDFHESQMDSAIGEAITALSAGLPYDALEHVKEVQRLFPESLLSKAYRDHAKSELQSIWNSAIREIENRKEERRRRYEEWRSRMEDHIERWSDRIAWLEEHINRWEAQIDVCEDIAANARTDEHAAEIEGWIREKQDKIADVQKSIHELQEKIRSVEDKLREREQ